MTVLDIIKNALAEINFVSAEQTLSPANEAYCFDRLNRLLDSWKTQPRYSYVTERHEFALNPSKQSYTIGPAPADCVVSSRPVAIKYANLIMDAVRLPLESIKVGTYADIPMPALGSTHPIRLYYQPTYPAGTLWPWPYPTDTSLLLELFIPFVIEPYATVNDDVSWPPGYLDAITLSLAEALCPWAGREVPAELREAARKARAAISAVNVSALTQESDYPSGSRGGMRWDPQIRGWR